MAEVGGMIALLLSRTMRRLQRAVVRRDMALMIASQAKFLVRIRCLSATKRANEPNSNKIASSLDRETHRYYGKSFLGFSIPAPYVRVCATVCGMI